MADKTERTFIMLKPDAIHRGLMGEVIKRFEQKGFKLVAMKLMWASDELLKNHYADLSSKSFFPGLIKYMSSGPVLPMVWQGKNIVKTGRVMLGETNPVDSKPGTIRGDYGIEVGRNICHGSDGVESAKKEIDLWFNEKEQITWTPVADSWIYESMPTETFADENVVRGQVNNEQVDIPAISLDLQEVVILHRSPHAWSKNKIIDSKVIANKFRSILNKLTPQRFTLLSKQADDLNISTENHLTSCVDILFEKAINEPFFSSIYARFASHPFALTVPLGDSTETVSFRMGILRKCQNEFERNTQRKKTMVGAQKGIDATQDKVVKKQLAECLKKEKKRYLGITKFIGEIFNNHMLAKVIICEFLRICLIQKDDEFLLESLCLLLTTTGQKLDKDDDFINSCFNRLHQIIKEYTVSARIRFMIMDLVDLRKANWKPKRENVPTTIDQIHEEVRLEKLERKLTWNKKDLSNRVQLS